MAEKGMEKVTMMKLKVDLECSKCYRKVKKVLCQIPQIRDQMFDEKTNTVIIKVVCCSPEKIMDKLCCKGGGSIKSIEILQPPKPLPLPLPPQKSKEPQQPKASEKAVEAPPPVMQEAALCCDGPMIGFNGYYARPVFDSWGGGPPSSCHHCFSHSDPHTCPLM